MSIRLVFRMKILWMSVGPAISASKSRGLSFLSLLTHIKWLSGSLNEKIAQKQHFVWNVLLFSLSGTRKMALGKSYPHEKYNDSISWVASESVNSPRGSNNKIVSLDLCSRETIFFYFPEKNWQHLLLTNCSIVFLPR